MTQLNCTVRNCRYNEDSLCCKHDIIIEGHSATSSDETCCGSFAERSSDSAHNRVGEPEKETEVQCKAKECVHNDDCRCKATNIGVTGSNACCCGETECDTFFCR